MRDGYYNSQILFGFDKELDEAEKKEQRKKSKGKAEEKSKGNRANMIAQLLPERKSAIGKSARKSPVSRR